MLLYLSEIIKFLKLKEKDLSKDISKYRLTVDYSEDFRLFQNLINEFGDKIYYLKMREIIKF